MRTGIASFAAALALAGAAAGTAVAGAGDLDPAFGTGGKATFDLGGTADGFAVALRAGGQALMTGSRDKDGTSEAYAIQVTAQGALDPAFHDGDGIEPFAVGAT